MIFVRYVDDLVAGFEHEADAQRLWDASKVRAIRPRAQRGEARLLDFGRYAATRPQRQGHARPETFNVLGFKFICGKSRRGAFLRHRKTRGDRMAKDLYSMQCEFNQLGSLA